MSHKILVLGATGNVGLPLVRSLVSKGEQVKAGSRSGKPVEGAEGVAFDLADPASFGRALEGVDRLYLMLPSGYVDVVGLLGPVVEAAVARKIKIVFQSAIGVEADDNIPYRQVELAIEKSGVAFVILRPNWFSDNFQTYWKAGVAQGQLEIPAGQGKSSFIDARDIAESAAAALTSSAFDGKAFTLTGPEALDYHEAAAMLSKALDHNISYTAVEDAPFIATLIKAGLSPDYAAMLTSIFYPVREGWTAVVTPDVETLTGKAPRSLATYIADNLAALQA